MPRRNRRSLEPERAGGVPAHERREEWRGELYVVRSLAGTASLNPYRCPGCDQLIAAGRPHVVAWPAADPEATDRRHWHSACWGARGTRGPTTRTAPRSR